MSRFYLIVITLLISVSNLHSQEIDLLYLNRTDDDNLPINALLHQHFDTNQICWLRARFLVTDTLGNVVREVRHPIDSVSTGYGADHRFILPRGHNAEHGWYIAGTSLRTEIVNDEEVRHYGYYLKWINREGELEMLRIYGREEDLYAVGLVPTEDGGFIIGGNIQYERYHYTNTHVLKLSEDGEVIWENEYSFMPGHVRREYITDIAATSDDGLIAVGRREEPIHRDRDHFGWLLRLNPDGDTLWTQMLAPEGAGTGWFRYISRLSDDNFLIYGYFENFPIEEAPWLLKINDQGEILWQRKLYGTREESDIEINGMLEMQDDNLLLYGWDHYRIGNAVMYLFDTNGDSLQFMMSDSIMCYYGMCHSLDGGFFTNADIITERRQIYYALLKYSYDSGDESINICSQNPDHIILSAYPNPFNNSILISYYIDKPSNINFCLYNTNGRFLYRVANEYVSPGNYNKIIDTCCFPTGMYVLSADGAILKKLIKLR